MGWGLSAASHISTTWEPGMASSKNQLNTQAMGAAWGLRTLESSLLLSYKVAPYYNLDLKGCNQENCLLPLPEGQRSSQGGSTGSDLPS